ncbi:hypothetical protein NMY22_g10759 [Coprinellus aureogranulatus]|nr:hypothetical protein NMY22_g10759 [Coprinellus aureogranulatus]
MPRSTPITRIPDTLPQEKRPKKTTHLNAVWARDYKDNTSGARPSKGKHQNRKEVQNRFRVALWENDDSEVNTIMVDHTECPSFDQGQWSVEESPTILKELGGPSARFKVYMKDSGIWVTCTPATVLSVQSDGYVFIKGLDVKTCQGFKELLNQRKPSLYPGLGNPKLLPARKSSTVSDSDVEVVTTPIATSKKRKGKGREGARKPRPSVNESVLSISDESAVATPRPSKKACVISHVVSDSPLVITSEDSFSLDDSDDIGLGHFFGNNFETTQGESSSAATTPGPSTSVADMSLGSNDLERIPGTTSRWPFSLYVCDMVTGFRKMASLQGKPEYTIPPSTGQGGAGTFDYKAAFAVAFPGELAPEPRTYRTHREAWKKAKDDNELQDWYEAGRCDNATWRKFFKTYGPKKATGT